MSGVWRSECEVEMIGTNLATRPFYNERIIRACITALGVLVAGFDCEPCVQLRALAQRAGRQVCAVDFKWEEDKALKVLKVPQDLVA